MEEVQVMSLEEAAQAISNEDAPITQRMTALFAARYHGGEGAVRALSSGLNASPDNCSILLRHEIAYNLGQVQHPEAVPILRRLLDDPREDEMVRHEAAEGLAAVGTKETYEMIRAHLTDPSVPVRDTVALALMSLEQKHPELKEGREGGMEGPSDGFVSCGCLVAERPVRNPFKEEGGKRGADGEKEAGAKENEGRGNGLLERGSSSSSSTKGAGKEAEKEGGEVFGTVDPMAAEKNVTAADIPRLEAQLKDEGAPLWKRYEALFALRNLASQSPEALRVLGRAMREDRASAVFRHEVAFVLGQLEPKDPEVLESLIECLKSTEEHPMARHEAALALGAVGSEEAVTALRTFLADPELVVAESCVVGLDFCGIAAELPFELRQTVA
uniref:Deoxyhypusine hydroxylase n=1 Tax=Chromera velia CCMP2878 TaxID=1169474 RepID=A0A0G4I1L8_9ALVE|mmetsp:Transcript_45657/g.89933  ORF Transcript_45657/g.89933 Transcript_45657/m.89933 type:complete len:387 (+) Transcript_45657:186-1346(+)|eukprot:Cvel_10185.t1-p1 / transcript=Cvel_10185.t1 / gene=Cvel_10185 / organism=Chromera_velia_CCMP2878 / gene_product=Deoxyhypusine hydroxylase, putative / transcript_product=Deoxyhypusine hydroxylase, putative / location=Cvel_scaffold608:66696-70611(+) / protein_length=386 / sequence_SO=supercontig / SO=protein_coding / is_pseudo=false